MNVNTFDEIGPQLVAIMSAAHSWTREHDPSIRPPINEMLIGADKATVINMLFASVGLHLATLDGVGIPVDEYLQQLALKEFT